MKRLLFTAIMAVSGCAGREAVMEEYVRAWTTSTGGNSPGPRNISRGARAMNARIAAAPWRGPVISWKMKSVLSGQSKSAGTGEGIE